MLDVKKKERRKNLFIHHIFVEIFQLAEEQKRSRKSKQKYKQKKCQDQSNREIH